MLSLSFALSLLTVDAPVEIARVPFEDESVYVLQQRAYAKRGHLEFTPMFTTLLNSRFVQSFGIWGSLAYHFKEAFALEVIGGYSGKPFTRYSETTLELDDRARVEPLPPDKVFMEWFAGGDLQWAPFYGKLRMIPGVLGDFDLYVLAGFGAVGTQAPCIRKGNYNGEGLDASGLDVQGISGACSDSQAEAFLRYETRFAAQFGGGFRIFFAKWFGARIEVRDIVYSVVINRKQLAKDETFTDIRNNVMFIFGLSFLI